MGKYKVLTALALTFSLIIWIQLVTTQVGANSIQAYVDIEPHVLLLKEGGCGRWITVHIGLPEPYDVNNIDVSSVTLKFLGNEVSGEVYKIQGKKLMVKFDRASVIGLLWPMIGHFSPRVKQDVRLIVTGICDGDVFEGTDTIRVFYTHL